MYFVRQNNLLVQIHFLVHPIAVNQMMSFRNVYSLQKNIIGDKYANVNYSLTTYTI